MGGVAALLLPPEAAPPSLSAAGFVVIFWLVLGHELLHAPISPVPDGCSATISGGRGRAASLRASRGLGRSG